MTTPTNLPSDFDGTHKPQPSVHKFEFTGKTEELWPIIWKNLLFNILTLSLYRFGGRTSVRRYLWAHTKVMGDPFEYTGKGQEMFVGFLIVFLTVFIPLGAAISYAQYLIVQQDLLPGIALFAVVGLLGLWLLHYAVYTSLRYRLSRTRWRGIKGALVGSPATYAWSAYAYSLVLAVTFGLARPYVENKLWNLQINNARMGSGGFSYQAEFDPLFAAFVRMIGYVVLAGISYFVIVLLAGLSGVVPIALIGALVGYAVFLWFFAKGIAAYEQKKLEHFLDNTKYEGTSLNFLGGRADMLRLIVGNVLLVLCTLGLAFPIVQLRVMRFIFSNLEIHGDIKLAEITQSPEAEPSFGEGLAEGFDIGTI